MFCLFLLYNVLNQSTQTPSLLSLPSTLSFHPSRPWQSPASYFTHDHVYMSMRLSQFTFPSLLPHPTCPQVHNFASITALKIGSISFFSMPTRWGVSSLTWYPHEITNNVNFYHLVKVPFARFLHWKIFILPIPYSMFWKQVIKSSLPCSLGSGMGIKFNHM